MSNEKNTELQLKANELRTQINVSTERLTEIPAERKKLDEALLEETERYNRNSLIRDIQSLQEIEKHLKLDIRQAEISLAQVKAEMANNELNTLENDYTKALEKQDVLGREHERIAAEFDQICKEVHRIESTLTNRRQDVQRFENEAVNLRSQKLDI